MQFGLAIGLSTFLMRMNFALAFTCFMVYAASVGLTTSVIYLIYTPTSIYVTFLVTAELQSNNLTLKEKVL